MYPSPFSTGRSPLAAFLASGGLTMLISLLIGLVVIGLVYWALTYLPLPPIVKQVGTVLLAIIAVLWLVGLLTGRQVIHL